MLSSLLSFLFPRGCPGCGQGLVEGEGAICLSCMLELAETGFHHHPHDNPLYYRIAGRVPLEGAGALYYFEKRGRMKRIATSLKYHRNPALGRFLGEYYGECLQGSAWAQGWEAIVPVPLHGRRLAARGYNQSAEFGRGLGRKLGVPMAEGILARTQHTSSQTRKGKSERWENVRDAFTMKRPLGGRILLVDDIVTTGATTEACIRTLLAQEIPPRIGLLAIALAR